MNRLAAGRPYPLGSTFDGKGTNFALTSANAERVELCLFDPQGKEQRFELANRNGNIWYGYLADCQPGQHYGYRVHGPYDPPRGQRFNMNKLLFDPYSRALSGKPQEYRLLFGGGEYLDEQDSAAVAPKSIVVHERYDWQNDQPPRTPWQNTIIYEAHVKGLTQLHPEIPESIRGSYAALAHPAMINHLLDLGVTALELQPIAIHADEAHLHSRGLSNYWGYNTLSPFVIEPSYGSGRANISPLTEFRDAVKALHKAGIEVILDVVFNHTAETDANGETFCFRGIDNASYYWLEAGGHYTNWSGCGNSLNCTSLPTIRWIMDCLSYWVSECHVDGFRFDLGTILGRVPAFTTTAPLLKAIITDPQLRQCKLIVEPWDIGLAGYQLGAFPAPFAEWNDQFRDTMRRFWLQQDVTLGEFAHAFAASSSYFQHNGRLPHASINFLTAHDGFTLRDLLSFNEKHNLANGEDNRDGHNDNFSNNHGTEGLFADEQTLQQRAASGRALVATLLLAQGTPMILAGDELGHSQQGNNNSYCQDNSLTWIDWSNGDSELTALFSQLLQLRKQIIPLMIADWWTEPAQSTIFGFAVSNNDNTEARWLAQSGEELSVEQWEQPGNNRLQIYLADNWLLLINASEQWQTYCLPAGPWRQRFCSLASDMNGQIVEHQHSVPARSLSVLTY